MPKDVRRTADGGGPSAPEAMLAAVESAQSGELDRSRGILAPHIQLTHLTLEMLLLALRDASSQHTFSLRWALRETDTASSRVPPGADGPDDVVLLNNDSDNFVLSSGANHLCMGLNRVGRCKLVYRPDLCGSLGVDPRLGWVLPTVQGCDFSSSLPISFVDMISHLKSMPASTTFEELAATSWFRNALKSKVPPDADANELQELLDLLKYTAFFFKYPLEAVPVPGQPGTVVYDYAGSPTPEDVAFIESRQWPQPEGVDLQDPDFATAIHTGRKVLAAGTCFELEAVRQEAVRLHAKHETWLRGRFEWLKNPANDLTRDLEAGDEVPDAAWELVAPRVLECSAAAQLQRCQEHTEYAVGHGIDGWMVGALGIYAAGSGTLLKFCLTKYPKNILFEQRLRGISAADREWSDAVGALLTAAADLEGDAASRLQAVVLGSSDDSHTIGLEVLRDDGRPVDIIPTQVLEKRTELRQDQYQEWDEVVDKDGRGGISRDIHRLLIVGGRLGLSGTALDQLGVPRGVTITMQWRLSGELLCMGRLRNDCWSTDGDWIGNAASLLQALAEAAEARGADPGKLRFWMCYSPATEAAAASGSGSEAEPPDAQDAADLFPPYRGAPGSMAVGVLNGQHLVPMTPEQVYQRLPQLSRRLLSLGFKLAPEDTVTISMVAWRSLWSLTFRFYIPGPRIAAMLKIQDGAVVRIVSNDDKIITDTRAEADRGPGSWCILRDGNAAMQALLDHVDASADIDEVDVSFKAGATLPGGEQELRLIFHADGKPIVWDKVALDEALARADSSWKADNDGWGVVRRCSGNIYQDAPMELNNIHPPGPLVRKMGLSATTYAANVLSSPDSPTVPLRVRATGWSTGSAVIDTEPLQQQLRGVFRVLRGRGQPVHCVHMAVGHGAAAAADSSPQLDFAYLDAAGTLLTVEEKDIKTYGEAGAYGGAGWAFPAQPPHYIRRLLDELPNKRHIYELHVPGEAQRHLRLPVCDTPIEWQFATGPADSWLCGKTTRYAGQTKSGTAIHLGVGNSALHVLQVARQAATAATLAARSSGPGEHGSSGDDGSGCSLQIQHANDQWFKCWPDKLLTPIPEQQLKAAIARALAALPPGAKTSVVWARERARLYEQDKLPPGHVPKGMQEPLQPVRLIFSLVDSHGQPVPGFDRAAFDAAGRAAEQGAAEKKKRGEVAQLGTAEPVGERRTRQRRGR